MELALLQQVARELNELLPGGFVNKIHQPLPREIWLRIRTPRGGEQRLVLSADPQVGRLHLTALRIPNPPSPPRFCAYLRAHFQGARIVEVTAAQDDRVVRIAALRGPADARQHRQLILELLGRDSNIILIDGDSHRIMECLHHIPQKEAGSRSVLPGIPYVAPPKRQGVSGAAVEDAERKAGIRRLASGKSSVVLDAVEGQDEVFPTVNNALNAFFAPRLTSSLLEALRRQVAAPLKARIRSLDRRMGKIEQDKRRLDEFRARREEGELLKANLRLAKKGMTGIEVVDWTTGAPRQISLDPSLDAIGNMERIFKKAAKARRGEAVVQRRREETLAEKAALEDVLYFVQETRETEELERMATEMNLRSSREGTEARRRDSSSSVERSKPFHELATPTGRAVLVGKSGLGNDIILRRAAGKEDLWFHVKGFPGAHVLLVHRTSEPASEAEIEFAASVAVHFSRARGKGKVEVMAANAGDVRRIKGGSPGQVVVRKYRTVLSDGSGYIA
jgi:predicted ribosome quality control (RQC) complex YloA/Tae2 family protein